MPENPSPFDDGEEAPEDKGQFCEARHKLLAHFEQEEEERLAAERAEEEWLQEFADGLDANSTDADWLTAKRAQRERFQQQALAETLRRKAAREAREEDKRQRWVLRDIAATQRQREQREAHAAWSARWAEEEVRRAEAHRQHAKWAAEEAARRREEARRHSEFVRKADELNHRRSVRARLERQEAASARHVMSRDDDGCSGF